MQSGKQTDEACDRENAPDAFFVIKKFNYMENDTLTPDNYINRNRFIQFFFFIYIRMAFE